MTFHFNKKQIQHALLLAGFALASIGWLAGLWLAYNQAPGLQTWASGTVGHAAFLGFGMVALVASIPCALVILIHKFIPDERQHYKRTISTVPQVTILENKMASFQFAKRHPLFYLLAYIFGAIIFAFGISTVSLSSRNGSDLFAFCSFIIACAACCVIACLICFAFLTKRWDPYFDSQIQKFEIRIAQARRRHVENPTPNSSPLSQLTKRLFRR